MSEFFLLLTESFLIASLNVFGKGWFHAIRLKNREGMHVQQLGMKMHFQALMQPSSNRRLK